MFRRKDIRDDGKEEDQSQLNKNVRRLGRLLWRRGKSRVLDYRIIVNQNLSLVPVGKPFTENQEDRSKVSQYHYHKYSII
jgi:hypothetical protein